jgi:Ca-activated chloride channel family protein
MKTTVALILLFFTVSTDGARKANEAYEKGDYVTAEAGYREALLVSPDDARLHFNLGNALTCQGKFDEAVTAYEQFKSMTSNPRERAAADYNIGNIHGAKEEWAKAAERYRESLRSNPDDAQAQYNYELARRRLTQPPPQSQKQQGDQEKNEQKQDQQQQQQDGQPQQQQQDGQGEQSDPKSSPNAREGQMSQREAEQILNALENKEKELLKEYQKKQIPPRTRHAKDW